MSVELSENLLKDWKILHDNNKANIQKSDECDQALVNVISTGRRQRDELNKLFHEFGLVHQIKSKLSEIQEQTKGIFSLFDFLQNEILHRLEIQKKEEEFQKWRLSEVNNLRKFEIHQKRKLNQFETSRKKKYNEEFLRLEKSQNDVKRLRELFKLQKEKEAEEAAYLKKKGEEKKRQDEIRRKIEEQFLIERKRMDERKRLEKERLEKVMEERKRKAEERKRRKEEEFHLRQLQMNTSPARNTEPVQINTPERNLLEQVIGSPSQKEESEGERLQRMEQENRLLKERLELLQKLKELEKQDGK